MPLHLNIEIARDEEFCSLDDFRLFVALFRPSAFERRPDQRCPLDDIRAGNPPAKPAGAWWK